MEIHEAQQTWEHHSHGETVHTHVHYHVTHNFNDRVGGFDHLSSEHEHDHDHAETSHAHYPHQDFDNEHRFEAHDHDHGEPVRRRAPGAKATQKPAQKASAARKKAAPRSRSAG